MSETRRMQLSEEAIASWEHFDLGISSSVRRNFVVSASRVGDWDRSWDFFAYSYSRAFEVLWDAAYARGSSGIFDYPVLFIARHSIELWLKVAIQSVTLSDPPEGHGLHYLWTKLMEALENHMGSPLDDFYSGSVREMISALDSHDGKGDRFRYPAARNCKTYMSSMVDLEELYRAHELITGFCDAVETQMTVERDQEHWATCDL
ncbi:MAG: hypothetical protein OXI73_07140 [Rhodospirillales bacterium]|nr:hypothetical protein [Rhodospirillales bacterium]